MDPKVYPKRNTFVIQNMDDGRKQIGKPHKSRSAANAALKKLVGDIATGDVVVGDRYKFKEEYKNFAELQIAQAKDPSVRLTLASVKGYESFYRNYIVDCFPDYVEIKNAQGQKVKKPCVYLDEITGKALRAFIICCYQKKKAPWKTVKNIVSKIKTFLRYCVAEDMVNENHVKNVLYWKMSKQYDLQPMDDDLYYPRETIPISPEEIEKLMNNLVKNKDKDFYSAYKLMAIATQVFTGLRYGELKGIKKDVIDLKKQSIFIAGVFSHSEGMWKNKTKRKASRRHIEIQNGFMPILVWWLKKIKDMRNPYLLPSKRGTGPISDAWFRTLVWKTYEENDLATIEWRKKKYGGEHTKGYSTTFTIISSPFKWFPNKTFRHALGTALVNAVKSDPNLDQNYVRSVLGHGLYSTTEKVYGTHIMRVTNEERIARRAAVASAMKLKPTLKLIK